MELQFTTMDNDIRLIKLTGKMDIVGTGEMETKFTGYCAGEKVRVIVDLSEVDFLSSIGIRLLTRTAKFVVKQGGKMVLINPIPGVNNVLEVSGIPEIIPVYYYLESAETILLA
jgi:anti-anti-sigma factor